MTKFDRAMVTIVTRKKFKITLTEDEMLPLIREEMQNFKAHIHEIVQDHTEDEPLSRTIHGWMIRELACHLADINAPNNLT
jgi:hypothetical protein